MTSHRPASLRVRITVCRPTGTTGRDLLPCQRALTARTLAPDDDGPSIHAVTAEGIDIVIEAQPGDWVPDVGDIATRVTMTPAGTAAEVFVGVAAEDDLDRYLTGVAQAQVTQVNEPSGATYRTPGGGTQPAPPADQGFWVTSTQGPGTQTLEWDA